MSCINKNLKEWKSLDNRYGDFIAELLVRGHIKNRYLNEESDNFYIPSLSEAIDILKSQIPAAAKRKIMNQLSINPYTKVETLASYLIGFIHKDNVKYGGEYVINVGNKNGNKFAKKDIFQPSVRLINELKQLYPDIFQTERTYDGNTFKVFITPRTEPKQTDIFQSPSMQNAIDTLKYLTSELGYQPNVFDIGNQRWIEAGTNLYNLVNKDTGTVVGNTINLVTGVEETKATPIDQEIADMAISEVESLARNEGFVMLISSKGYNIDVILANMREATTQEELDIELVKIKKLYC
tara:strand:- start:4066 stop:4950 length:885 start_codon:yes stop_codon:yes gene_type:complete